MTTTPARLLSSDYHRALLSELVRRGWSKTEIAQAMGWQRWTVKKILGAHRPVKYPEQCLLESLLPTERVHELRDKSLANNQRASYWDRIIEAKSHGTRS